MLRVISLLFIAISLLSSCRVIKTQPEEYADYQPKGRSHMIAIFMDGTMDKPNATKEWRNTNVWRAYDWADTNIKRLYIEGVGAGMRVKDAKKAFTTRDRVMMTYRFLTENYESDKDSICLFGFSRGANQCRILSSIIYTIGIVNLKQIEEPERQELLLQLYDEYAGTIGASEKKYKLAMLLNSRGLEHEKHYDTTGKTKIELMGLWDTVEAFEIDRKETTTPLPEHLNQLYNVNKLFHATSLDDNRAFTYTPILATHKDVSLHRDQNIDSIVKEVWFNGSHKNVGGGVRGKKKDKLTGISLHWMWSRVAPYHIFRQPTLAVDTFAKASNMRGNPFLWILSPGDTLRGINKYLAAMNPDWNGHRIKVHRSVISRLESGVIPKFKLRKWWRKRTDWYDWEPFKDCFTKEVDSLGKTLIKLKPDYKCPCIEVVND